MLELYNATYDAIEELGEWESIVERDATSEDLDEMIAKTQSACSLVQEFRPVLDEHCRELEDNDPPVETTSLMRAVVGIAPTYHTLCNFERELECLTEQVEEARPDDDVLAEWDANAEVRRCEEAIQYYDEALAEGETWWWDPHRTLSIEKHGRVLGTLLDMPRWVRYRITLARNRASKTQVA